MNADKTNKDNAGNINQVRVNWCFVYLVLGLMLLTAFCLTKFLTLQDFLMLKLPLILWSASWSAVGIGLCLWNSRTSGAKKGNTHYVTYFLFIFVFSTIAAVAFSENVDEIQVYLKALVIALGIGFTGEKLQAIK